MTLAITLVLVLVASALVIRFVIFHKPRPTLSHVVDVEMPVVDDDESDPRLRALGMVSQQLALVRQEVRETRESTDAKVAVFRRLVIAFLAVTVITAPLAISSFTANSRLCTSSNDFRTRHNHLVADTEQVLVNAKKVVDASPTATPDQRSQADTFYQQQIDNFEANDKILLRDCSFWHSLFDN